MNLRSILYLSVDHLHLKFHSGDQNYLPPLPRFVLPEALWNIDIV